LSAKDRVKGVSYLPLDLEKEKTIASLVRSVGEVDLLVSNAGESPVGAAEEIPIKKMRDHFQINFFGPAMLMQGVVPGMRGRKTGMIIFVGSIRSEVPTPFSSIYAASKAAIRAFAECLRIELLGTGVRVAVIAPWYVRTSLPQNLLSPARSPYSEAIKGVREVRERMIGSSPDPSTVADAVLRLLKAKDPAPFTVVGRPLMTFFLRHAPRGLVVKMSTRVTGMRPIR
ncbi:MAG TPA: SDR family NAD(P)-dependent oxidoreductase, partial [Spirochaetia bacterium]|nr:SDR family NAD(P)-dependent oxidoreductase [Spirochaetia bacterium]